MKSLLKVSRAIDTVSDGAGVASNWFVLLAVLISAGNATVRYLFSYSSNGWLEIQWYLFGALVLLGASQTLRKNEHVRVDLVYSSVSDRVRLWIDTIGFLFVLIPAAIFFTYLSIPFFLKSFHEMEVSSNAGGLILWPIKLVLPIGFALLALQAISELIKRIAGLTGDVALDTHYEKPLQ